MSMRSAMVHFAPVFLFTTLALVRPSGVAGQRITATGDRVRIETRGPTGDVVGTVRAVSPQGIEIADERGRATFVVRDAVRTVAVSGGEEIRQGRKGLATLAFTLVTGGGAAMGAGVWSPCTDTGMFACMLHPDSRQNAAVVGAVIALPFAIVIARALGKDHTVDSWEAAELPTRERPSQESGPTVRIFPGGSAGDLGIGLAFPLGR